MTFFGGQFFESCPDLLHTCKEKSNLGVGKISSLDSNFFFFNDFWKLKNRKNHKNSKNARNADPIAGNPL